LSKTSHWEGVFCRQASLAECLAGEAPKDELDGKIQDRIFSNDLRVFDTRQFVGIFGITYPRNIVPQRVGMH
jgi:hypothetical protein